MCFQHSVIIRRVNVDYSSSVPEGGGGKSGNREMGATFSLRKSFRTKSLGIFPNSRFPPPPRLSPKKSSSFNSEMSNLWASPIAKKDTVAKEKEEELKLFKKAKCKISKGHAKRIVMAKDVDSAGCAWIERWIDNLVRGNCFPPQLVSDDFYASLPKFFAPDKVLSILEEVRRDYKRAFPLSSIDDEDDLSWLSDELKKDVAVMCEYKNLLSG